MTACHAPSHPANGQPAAYDLTYRTPPLVGRHAGPGTTFTETVCASCRDPWAGQIEAAGGTVIGLKALPEPPSVRLAPVGLEPIAPPVEPEPVTVRVRSRSRVAGEG